MRRRRGIMGLNGGAGIPVITATATGNPLTFETDMIKPLKSLVIPFTPIQAGSGDPSPTNVRPISGWTGCGIFQAQKNLFNKNAQPYRTGGYISQYAQVGENVASRITNNANYNIYALSVKPGQNYCFGIIRTVQPRMVAIDHDQKILAVYANIGGNGYLNCLVPDSVEYLLFSVAVAGTYKNIDDFQVEFGTVHSACEAYHGAEIPVTFTDPTTGDPLTIYDGTLTLNEDGSVDLVSSWRRVTFPADGTGWDIASHGDNWTSATIDVSAADRCVQNTPAAGDRYGLCNLGPWRQSGGSSPVRAQCGHNARRIAIIILADNADTKAKVMEAIQALPATPEVVYKLYTPKTYHFDNVGQLITFVGTNNIWTDTNGTNTATYLKHQS